MVWPGSVPDLAPRGIPGWHGGPRARRDGGGPFWGGPGFPQGVPQVVYSNQCPPGTWWSHEAEQCLRKSDPFGDGGASGYGVGVLPLPARSALEFGVVYPAVTAGSGVGLVGLGLAVKASAPVAGWALIVGGVPLIALGAFGWWFRGAIGEMFTL